MPSGSVGALPSVNVAGMDAKTYAVEAETEETHWWFVGRRHLFAREISRLKLAKSAAVLDIGTSTGSNLRLLADLGFVRTSGIEVSEDALRYCRAKGFLRLCCGDVLDLPFLGASFDLVLATDILEHVDDDQRAIGEIARVLRPGGRALITVPAFPSLWGLQDRVARHRRRYRMGELRERLLAGGLAIDHAYHMNFLLFVPIWAARRLIDLLGAKIDSEARINSPLLNRVLRGVFGADIALAPYLRPPFGVSILAMAYKR
jgi:SAM-dependent methyltransferase